MLRGKLLDQWFEEFGKNIIHMHFVDGDPYGHLIWGDGNRPIDEFIQALNNNHYEGYLGQEITEARYFADPFNNDQRNMQALIKYF